MNFIFQFYFLVESVKCSIAYKKSPKVTLIYRIDKTPEFGLVRTYKLCFLILIIDGFLGRLVMKGTWIYVNSTNFHAGMQCVNKLDETKTRTYTKYLTLKVFRLFLWQRPQPSQCKTAEPPFWLCSEFLRRKCH